MEEAEEQGRWWMSDLEELGLWQFPASGCCLCEHLLAMLRKNKPRRQSPFTQKGRGPVSPRPLLDSPRRLSRG